ncbi:MAG: hypothetical protein QF692_05960 [Alphaproteobacteria bacterium]|jgi:hypothetical protein|nr:hypothetical protein [Alphaproteobacteria bacterium]MDP7222789.1 hypothetical protein [Alphaproteobacteria bacterium]
MDGELKNIFKAVKGKKVRQDIVKAFAEHKTLRCLLECVIDLKGRRFESSLTDTAWLEEGPAYQFTLNFDIAPLDSADNASAALQVVFGVDDAGDYTFRMTEYQNGEIVTEHPETAGAGRARKILEDFIDGLQDQYGIDDLRMLVEERTRTPVQAASSPQAEPR